MTPDIISQKDSLTFPQASKFILRSMWDLFTSCPPEDSAAVRKSNISSKIIMGLAGTYTDIDIGQKELFSKLKIPAEASTKANQQSMSSQACLLLQKFKELLEIPREPPYEKAAHKIPKDWFTPLEIIYAINKNSSHRIGSIKDDLAEQEFGRFLFSAMPRKLTRELGRLLFRSLSQLQRDSIKSDYKRFELLAKLLCEDLGKTIPFRKLRQMLIRNCAGRSHEGSRCWPSLQTELGSALVIQRKGTEINIVGPLGILPVWSGLSDDIGWRALTEKYNLTRVEAPDSAQGYFYKLGENSAEPVFCTADNTIPPLFALLIWQYIKPKHRTNSLREAVIATQTSALRDAAIQNAVPESLPNS